MYTHITGQDSLDTFSLLMIMAPASATAIIPVALPLELENMLNSQFYTDKSLVSCICLYLYYIHTYIHTYMYIPCTLVYDSVFIFIYIYTHIHTHTHTHTHCSCSAPSRA